MEQRISLITLGVADLRRARSFYEQLGWRGHEMEETVFFQAGGQAVILWSREKLAADAGIDDDGTNTFAGIRPSSVPGFVLSQLLGGVLGVALVRALYPGIAAVAGDVVVPGDPPIADSR